MPEQVNPGAVGELGWRLSQCGTDKSWARLPEVATAKKDQQNWLGQLGQLMCVCVVFF